MKIHYVTGAAAIFVVALHIMMRLVVPFEQSLEYDYIIANYKNIVFPCMDLTG
jgi:succinate dehydrogenase / fumarate reductase membrane anchor subunit